MVDFYHKKEGDLLRLGCTLSNLVLIRAPNLATAMFYPFAESDKGLLQKTGKNMLGHPSIVFRRKAVVNETLIRDSTNWFKRFDASQLYPHSMCQAML